MDESGGHRPWSGVCETAVVVASRASTTAIVLAILTEVATMVWQAWTLPQGPLRSSDGQAVGTLVTLIWLASFLALVGFVSGLLAVAFKPSWRTAILACTSFAVFCWFFGVALSTISSGRILR